MKLRLFLSCAIGFSERLCAARPIRIRPSGVHSMVAVSVVMALILSSTTPSLAQRVTVTGANGATADDAEPGLDGDRGGDAEPALAVADSQELDEFDNRARALGGDAGDGGRGGDGTSNEAGGFNGQPGGDGGHGGSADAYALLPFDPAIARAFSLGGRGGTGGLPGTPDLDGSDAIGVQGDGGDGGAAVSEITGRSTARRRSDLRATSQGGIGADGGSGGQGGEARARIDVSLIEAQDVQVQADGGQGGNGSGGFHSSRAGDGGKAFASSAVTSNSSQTSDFEITANGGAGGSALSDGTAAGQGGSAHAETQSSGRTNTSVRAVGGRGGLARGVDARGGTGGSATISSIGTSRPVFVNTVGRALGGHGGTGVAGAAGGHGANTILVDQLDGSSTVETVLEQNAVGGDGGAALGDVDAQSGNGGLALSELDRMISTESLQLSTFAEGGDAGRFVGEAPASLAGVAIATTIAENPQGSTSASAVARGGEGASSFDRTRSGVGDGGHGGKAIATAASTSIADDSHAETIAFATGGDGGDAPILSGNGGSATSRATSLTLGLESSTSVNSSAVGGDGGFVLYTPVREQGGNGGAARAEASASSISGPVAIVATARSGDGGEGAEVVGGNGGEASAVASGSSKTGPIDIAVSVQGGRGGTGHRGMGDGGSGGEASATATGSAGTGPVDIRVVAEGGHGGIARLYGSGIVGTGGRGGRGADTVLQNSVGGTTSSDLSLSQTAIAGRGGKATIGGDGGNAVSELARKHLGEGHLTLIVSATAGQAGFGTTASGADGHATIAASGEGRRNVTIDATANLAKSGGVSIGEIHGESTGGGDVSVSFASAVSGIAVGIDGADLTVENAVTGVTTGSLTLVQTAEAGSGHSPFLDEAAVVVGGDATSRLHQDLGSQTASILVAATGGTIAGSGIGRGGNATSATIVRSSAVNGGLYRALDRATAGASGSGGGVGGKATSLADVRNTGAGTVEVESVAQGGDGYGGGEASASAYGSSETGRVEVLATQQAGGGRLVGDRSVLPDLDLNGTDSIMIDAVNGTTAGQLMLVQRSVGGEGSRFSTPIIGDGGHGGNAFSRLTEANQGSGETFARTYATGGAGGAGYGLVFASGRGGDAQTSARMKDTKARLSLALEAVGGAGGESGTGDFKSSGGDGGAATIGDTFASSSDGSPVSIHATAIGGDGGAVTGPPLRSFQGGDGASVHLDNTIDGATTGELSLTQNAVGGSGGMVAGRGRAGRGGDASSSLDLVGESERLAATVSAIGGDGAAALDGTGGLAGDANARIEAAGEDGDLSLAAFAIGGDGGLSGEIENGGRRGGNAVARANAYGKRRVVAESTATAGLGGFGLAGDVIAKAAAHSQESAVASSRAIGAGATTALAMSVLETSARAISRVEVEVSSIGAGGGGALAAAFDESAPFVPPSSPPGSHTIVSVPESIVAGNLASIDIRLHRMGLGEYLVDQRSIINLALSTPMKSPRERLVLRFEDWGAIGTSLEGLRVAIWRDGSTIVDEAFADVAAALIFFSSGDIALGDFKTSMGDSKIRIGLTMGARNVGDQLFGQISLLVVPEPSTALLMMIGLVVLARK